jgi:hypothetical protein
MNKFHLESWIVGFVDGEGCFSISFTRRNGLKVGLEVRASFSVSQNTRSKQALLKVGEFFCCGSIRESKKDNTWKYEVRNIDELYKTILPFFRKYPLLTNKQKDFEAWSTVLQKIKQGHHLNPEGLKEIIDVAFSMNSKGYSRKYTKEELLQILES